MSEPTIIQEQVREGKGNERPSFSREESDAPPDWLDTPFRVLYEHLNHGLSIVLEVRPSLEYGCADTKKPFYALDKKARMLIKVRDISKDGRVIFEWIAFEGRGGGGNLRLMACAVASCTPEQIRWIKEQWSLQQDERHFQERFQSALQKEGLDWETITRKRIEILATIGLDEQTVACRRQQALRETGLDDDSVKGRRHALETLIRSEG